MHYLLESVGVWDPILSNVENLKPAPIDLKGEYLNDERQEKCVDKFKAWNKINSNDKGYLGRMCLNHIQKDFQAIKTSWEAHNLWEWLKNRYTLQNTANYCPL